MNLVLKDTAEKKSGSVPKELCSSCTSKFNRREASDAVFLKRKNPEQIRVLQESFLNNYLPKIFSTAPESMGYFSST